MWIKLHDHFWLFHQWLKKRPVFETLFLQLGTRFSGKINCCCSEVAVTERFEQESKYGLSAVTKKSDWCQEVTWPLVEVQLYLFWQQIAAIVFPLLLSWLWLNPWNETCVEKRQNSGVYITRRQWLSSFSCDGVINEISWWKFGWYFPGIFADGS